MPLFQKINKYIIKLNAENIYMKFLKGGIKYESKRLYVQ